MPDEIEQIQQAIAALEAQREILGEQVLATALAPLRQRLEQLQMQSIGEQRKVVTILFADLAGFTAMSEKMDPEDVRDVTDAYFKCWTEVIEANRGTVEKFIGDAVMAVFGLKAASEQDPENAVRAALAMRDALEELNGELEREQQIRLHMRVGVHTGPVVVSLLGERKGQDFVVVGDTVNLASRLQSAAPEGGILDLGGYLPLRARRLRCGSPRSGERQRQERAGAGIPRAARQAALVPPRQPGHRRRCGEAGRAAG